MNDNGFSGRVTEFYRPRSIKRAVLRVRKRVGAEAASLLNNWLADQGSVP